MRKKTMHVSADSDCSTYFLCAGGFKETRMASATTSTMGPRMPSDTTSSMGSTLASFDRNPLFGTLSAALLDDFDVANGNSTFAEGSYIPPNFLNSFHVEGVGELRLPLPTDDFTKLVMVGDQAAITGPGGCILQIDASKVTFPPDFSNRLRLFAIAAVLPLGLDGAAVQLEAHLCKVLLSGTRFTTQRDSERAPGLFATLVLQLPTEEGFGGGALHFRQGETTKTFDFSSNSATMAAYAVFNAGCEHKIQTTLGKRLCLVFNLVRRNVEFDMPLGELREFSSRLWKAEEALHLWREALTIRGARGERVPRGRQNKLAIPLKHRYTKRNLSFSGLKEKDRMVAHVLKNCRDAGRPWLDLHLCMMTVYKKGRAEENSYKRRRPEFDFEDGVFDDNSDDYDVENELCVEESFTDPNWAQTVRKRRTVNYADDRLDDCHRMGDVKRETVKCDNWVDIYNRRCDFALRIKQDTELVYDNEKHKTPYYDREGAGPDEVAFERRFDKHGDILQQWYYPAMLVIWPKTKP
ncbi:hypothetical protein KC19_3G188500 [Ceratodon purpureus]|uniref:Fe2OG dioxygenase domain-containing protein n=1 Tax=Ceratodon purpureus TaxID=3225 RepID=A0A8T0IMT6_CERPU|nr:hypothetical protein KC19_3G188500 [Ceratodon purpureus]